MALTVEIWSDVVCPWCYVGKRHLDAAVAEFDHEVDVVWRSFRLDPHGGTFDAHRLIHLAAAHGKQDAAMERLMRAHFSDDVPMDDHKALVSLAGDIGLDPEQARTVLAGDAYADAVRADEELARRIGIQGVPYFVLDRRFGVSGAQPADVLVRALEKACA